MKLKRNIQKLLPLYGILPLLSALIGNLLVYYVSKWIASGLLHHDMTIALDGRIPFLPWTVYFYVLGFVLLVGCYWLATRQPRQQVMRYFSAVVLAKLICFLFFVFYPTAVQRPEILPGQAGGWLLGIIYAADAPTNLFPSIHCLWCGFMVLAVRRRDIPLWCRFVTAVLAACVAVSTLTTKQHVTVDLFAGIPLAFICYGITEKIGFCRLFDRLCRRGEELLKLN